MIALAWSWNTNKIRIIRKRKRNIRKDQKKMKRSSNMSLKRPSRRRKDI